MSSGNFVAHHGLANAVGPCSAETEAALGRLLSYFGISCVLAGRSSTPHPIFALSLSGESTIDSTQQIEFYSETKSWHRTRTASISSPTSTSDAVLTSNAGTCNIPCSLSREVLLDWTTLLPATKHVDFLRSRQWHKTILGPMLEWPSSLRLMTMKMLGDPRPANLYWGPNRIAIYNEPFSIVAASRHPVLMGSTAEDALPTTYPFLSEIFDEIEKTGTAFSMPEFEMTVEKVTGFIEEAWYDGTFSPIRDTDGTFLGLYNSGYEVTDRKLAQRNSEVIHQIAAGSTSPGTSPWQHVIDVCSKFDRDVPFLVLYSADEQEAIQSSGLKVQFQGSLGIEEGHPAIPKYLDIYHGNEGFMPILRAAKAKASSVVLDMQGGELPDFLDDIVNWRGHGDACTHIIASPLYTMGLLTGFLIIGLNPRRRYDEVHEQFVEDIRRAVNSLLAHHISISQARTREEKLTQELTERQRFLQRVAEIAMVGIYTYSVDGLLTWANPKFFDISGVTQKPEERYNYQGLSYVMDEDQERGREGFRRCFETKSSCTLELRLRRTWRPSESEHDEPRWIMTTLTPNVENDEVVDFLGCITDISHLKWAEKFQMQMAEAAKRAKQQQERFIDTTSHEMRNPLSAILQCADDITTLAKSHEALFEAHADALQNILDNARSILFCAAHQNRIVDDILTVSKLDSSMLVVTPVVTNPHMVAVQTLQAFASKMAAEDIRSCLEVQSGYTDLQINSTYNDPSRITQILINLITNAMKFTKSAQRREICVRINAIRERPLLHGSSSRVQWFPSNALLAKHYDKSPASESSDGTTFIMFEVEDSGTGISQEEMKSLFNRFAQATPKTHITYGGSGLGLFISRELVEIQGGMIGVSSQLGVGSLFAFYVETQRAEFSEDGLESESQQITWYEGLNDVTKKNKQHESLKPSGSIDKQPPSYSEASPRSKHLKSSKSSKSWSILFVEDNLINQKVLSKQLERLGCEVHVVNHGAEALEFIRRSAHWIDNQASTQEIDVVLMDWEMPVMDGVTCTRQIREMEVTGSITKHLLVIGATANARPEQVEVALSAGMDDLITKPFTVRTLMKRIEELMV